MLRFFEFRHDDPWPEIWGAMLFPNEEDRAKREAYIGDKRLGYYPDFFGETQPRIVVDEARRIDRKQRPERAEIKDREERGMIAGDLLVFIMAIAQDEPKRASWNTAVKLLRRHTGFDRTMIWSAGTVFAPVAHLWAAWSLRGKKWHEDETAGYTRAIDVEIFLAEAMAILQWARTNRLPRAQAQTTIKPTVVPWSAPPNWTPPIPQKGWPRDGDVAVPHLTPEWRALIFKKAKKKPIRDIGG